MSNMNVVFTVLTMKWSLNMGETLLEWLKTPSAEIRAREEKTTKLFREGNISMIQIEEISTHSQIPWTKFKNNGTIVII